MVVTVVTEEAKIASFERFLRALEQAKDDWSSKGHQILDLYKYVEACGKGWQFCSTGNAMNVDQVFIAELKQRKPGSWEGGRKLVCRHIENWVGIGSSGLPRVSQPSPQKSKFRPKWPGRGDPVLALNGYIVQGKTGMDWLRRNTRVSTTEICNTESSGIAVSERRQKEAKELEAEIEKKKAHLTQIEDHRKQCEDELRKILAECSTYKNTREQLKLDNNRETGRLEALKGQTASLQSTSHDLSDQIKKLKQEKVDLANSIKELSEKETRIKELKNAIDYETENAFEKYLKDADIMGHLLSLSKEVSDSYQDTMRRLNAGHRREHINNRLMTSLFWITCMEEAYKAIIDEKVRNIREKVDEKANGLNYEEMIRCLVNIGNVVEKTLPQCDSMRKTIHNFNEGNEVRAIVNSRIREVSDLYRREDWQKLANNLEEAKANLRKVNMDPHIKRFFVDSVISMEIPTRSATLAVAMIVCPLERYFREYGQRYY